MKKIYALLLAAGISSQLFAGGIVTNTNQSAQWVRMLSRNASTQIDAVYFNPAGLVRMDDGFHFSLHNQTIFQEKTVTTTFPGLNNDTYTGDVKVPFYPSFFGVYKKDKLAISFGFGINGGGGSAEFANGLPSFEMPVSLLPSLMTSNGIPTDEYLADVSFNGSSAYYGTQIGVSYAINDMISLSAGVRLIMAKNSYEGHLNISVNPMHPLNPNGAGNMVSAPLFFNTLAATATGAANSVQPIIDAGAGSFTLDQLVGAGQITQAQADQLSGGLGANYNPAMNVTQIQAAYNQGAATASGYAARTADMVVDATQSGNAFTPIFGANFKINDKLNIAVKYEMNTKLELTNKSEPGKDANGMFLNDSTFRSDIPAILAIGAEYSVMEKLRVSGSYNLYFDKNADWNGKEEDVDKNLFEIALGAEYDVTDKLLVSAGFLMGRTGVNEAYQTDLSYSNSSNTIGLGGCYKITEKLSVDLGILFTTYEDATSDKVFPTSPTTSIPYTETYDKKTTDIAIGINYKF